MADGQIYVSEVIRMYQASGMSSHSGEFSLKYMYVNGNGVVMRRNFERCRRRTAGTLNRSEAKTIKGLSREQRDGSKLHIEFHDGREWLDRKLFIYGLTECDGKRINHLY